MRVEFDMTSPEMIGEFKHSFKYVITKDGGSSSVQITGSLGEKVMVKIPGSEFSFPRGVGVNLIMSVIETRGGKPNISYSGNVGSTQLIRGERFSTEERIREFGKAIMPKLIHPNVKVNILKINGKA